MATVSHQVLIETSALVAYLGRRRHPAQSVVAELIRAGRAATCGVVLSEMVFGEAYGRKESYVPVLLQSMHYLEFTQEAWIQSGRLNAHLHQQGMAIPLPDVLIAALAMQHGCALYTLDSHFQRISDLTLYSP